MAPLRLAILTVSDAASRGEREDASGAAIAAWAGERGYTVVSAEIVPDDPTAVSDFLTRLSDGDGADLVLTTGGTGFTERDTTPEATRSVLEREAPGLAEAIRVEGAGKTPMAWLSRGVAGIRGRTLIVNLPGSPSGVLDGLRVLDRVGEHAVQLVRGRDTHLHPHHG